MSSRRPPTDAAPLFTAAAASYLANCALGTAVAVKFIDTSGFRWLHHALYIATCTLSAAAVVASWWSRPVRTGRVAALALAPAAVPLTAIAAAGAHGRRHPLIALAAAPFFAASLMASWRPAHGK